MALSKVLIVARQSGIASYIADLSMADATKHNPWEAAGLARIVMQSGEIAVRAGFQGMPPGGV